MSAGPNGGARVFTILKPPSLLSSAICRSCQEKTLHRRSYANAATASSAAQTDTSPEVTATSSPSLKPAYAIKAGVVVSRAPRITRDLTPFEKAFYFYQKRLNERVVLPFTRYFYYERGTPGEVQWKKTLKERQTPSRDIGQYNAYSKEAWNDELLVGAKESEPDHMVNSLLQDAEGYLSSDSIDGTAQKEELPRPLPRVTEADQKGDYKSLDRALQRTLYLLVQGKRGQWRFPTGQVVMNGKESLVTAAERALSESAGPNMYTWMVGNHPIGHDVRTHRQPKPNTETGIETLGEKTFFMKSRIMAGQADVNGNVHDIMDFKWLTKEEIEKHVLPPYWSSIRNMLSER